MSNYTPREALSENCPTCGGADYGPTMRCQDCLGTGRRVRKTHDPASAVALEETPELEVQRLRLENASLRAELARSREHIEGPLHANEQERRDATAAITRVLDGHIHAFTIEKSGRQDDPWAGVQGAKSEGRPYRVCATCGLSEPYLRSRK